MAENRKLEFFFLRYVPEQIKGTHIDIGLVMIGEGFAEARFTRDWAQVLRLDPQADIPMLEALAKDIKEQISQLKEPATLLHWLQNLFSNLIQVSEIKACVVAHPEKEIEIMASIYLEPGKMFTEMKLAKNVSVQGKLRKKMQGAFEAESVWELMFKDIPMDKYTERGNPLKLDCGYPIGEAIKFFHAFSLKRNLAMAYKLADAFPKLSREIKRRDQTTAFLTAVVDDDVHPEQDRTRYAWSLMRDSDIHVVNVSEMPAIAQKAALELGVFRNH